MSTMYVKARRASAQTITNNTRTKITGLSLNEVDPLGAPSPWNNGTQKIAQAELTVCWIRA